MNTNDTMKQCAVPEDVILKAAKDYDQQQAPSERRRLSLMLRRDVRIADFQKALCGVVRAAMAAAPSVPQEPQTEQSTRPVTEQEDKWLRKAAQRSSTLVASGRLAQTEQPTTLEPVAWIRPEALVELTDPSEWMPVWARKRDETMLPVFATPQAAMALLVEARDALKKAQGMCPAGMVTRYDATLARIDAHLGKGKEQP